jgi:hypothetical protein
LIKLLQPVAGHPMCVGSQVRSASYLSGK